MGELNLLLPLPSWWQMKRYFTRLGNRRSVHYKLYPDVVIVHPEPRFNTAMNAEQWREACILALLAYCNHGPCCAATTFADLKSLQALGSRCCRSDENMYNRNWSFGYASCCTTQSTASRSRSSSRNIGCMSCKHNSVSESSHCSSNCRHCSASVAALFGLA